MERGPFRSSITSLTILLLIITLHLGCQSIPSVLGEHTTSFAAFGAISFSESVTDESVPINPVYEYRYGTIRICAVFPYMNMEDGMGYEVEWLYNGDWFYSTTGEWDEGAEGLTHRTISWEDDSELESGTYTLNLFIDGQLARSAYVEVLPPDEIILPKETREPEDLIDPDLMKAWEILAYSNNDLLSGLADIVVDYGVELRLRDDISSNGKYVYTSGSKEPGTVYVSWDFWKIKTWEEVSATLAHELAHAVQHLTSDEGTFGCTVEREYEAYMAEFYVLMVTDREDLLVKHWSGVYNPKTGKIWKNELWNALKDAYNDCPEY